MLAFRHRRVLGEQRMMRSGQWPRFTAMASVERCARFPSVRARGVFDGVGAERNGNVVQQCSRSTRDALVSHHTAG